MYIPCQTHETRMKRTRKITPPRPGGVIKETTKKERIKDGPNPIAMSGKKRDKIKRNIDEPKRASEYENAGVAIAVKNYG